ncbi:MAG: histidine kinase [Solidesulfovibrio sp. DCME]|uniref:PDC sensor domain-containing protein n=1 Tax=Solidesulfovibrio sp. DCME TaxID=3447380 RepID=UPI003D0A1363
MRHAALLALIVLLGLPAPAAAARSEAPPPLAQAVIAAAAGRLDDQLAALAQSAKALGTAYAALYRDAAGPDPGERAKFLQSYAVKDGTVAFRDAAGPCGGNPQGQAPCQALLYYDGENFTDETFRALTAMARLAPAMAAAHDAMPASWVYLTTPGQNFAIYPYLPLDEAVANYQPTEKDFYTAADFAKRDCGWESPYLDLAGAGMMVTVSCPVYDGDTLLGVSSRDLTLAQLSRHGLADLAALPGARAVLMNRRGKAIAASDPKVADFIVAANTKAGDAVVHFRDDRGLAALGQEKYVESPDANLNDAAEMVLEQAEGERTRPIAFTRGKELVLATRLPSTGWYLMLTLPQKAAR